MLRVIKIIWTVAIVLNALSAVLQGVDWAETGEITSIVLVGVHLMFFAVLFYFRYFRWSAWWD